MDVSIYMYVCIIYIYIYTHVTRIYAVFFWRGHTICIHVQADTHTHTKIHTYPYLRQCQPNIPLYIPTRSHTSTYGLRMWYRWGLTQTWVLFRSGGCPLSSRGPRDRWTRFCLVLRMPCFASWPCDAQCVF